MRSTNRKKTEVRRLIAIENANEGNAPDLSMKLKSYKAICARLGLAMCVYFICRTLAGFLVGVIAEMNGSGINPTLFYAMYSAIMLLFVYAIPMLLTMLLVKPSGIYGINTGELRLLYKTPKRLAKSLGSFPALYGFGLGVNLLTILVFYLLTHLFRSLGSVELEKFFEPMAVEAPQNLPSVLIMVFMMAIVAPIFEEFWVRGLIFDALDPYGAGMAIIISSIIFGLMHGSVHTLFYTTALGFALGYVRYATNSLFVVTILHFIINAIASGMMLLLTMTSMTDGENELVNVLTGMYILAMFVMIVIGIAAMIKKIPVMRRYKIKNNWPEASPKKKAALFFASIPVVIMVILAINEHANNPLLNAAVEFVTGIQRAGAR